jgi:hypothetical protein
MKALIIHCWDGSPSYCWYPRVKQQLEAQGFEVSVPVMPQTHAPKQKLWLPKLAETVTDLENTVLIGHSTGCITILRYLESLPSGKKCKGVVLVAGFTDNLGFDELSNFFETPINFEKIKTHSPAFIAIMSDNDPYVPLKHADIFKEKLGAKVIIKHNQGHFSDEGNYKELPDVVEVLKSMSSRANRR